MFSRYVYPLRRHESYGCNRITLIQQIHLHFWYLIVGCKTSLGNIVVFSFIWRVCLWVSNGIAETWNIGTQLFMDVIRCMESFSSICPCWWHIALQQMIPGLWKIMSYFSKQENFHCTCENVIYNQYFIRRIRKHHENISRNVIL